MTEISKEILEKYQIRKTKKQKSEFIGFMSTKFPELKVEKGGLAENQNLVIGDLSTAKTVFGAHYDTCAAMPIPNFIMPKNILASILYGFAIILPIVIIALIPSILTGWLTKNETLPRFVFLGIYFILLGLVFMGKPNEHTANDNTSGVITLVELLSTMPAEERGNYAFVFFDNEENGLLGSSWFAKKHKDLMKDKLLINFDCVSDGDNIMFILSKPAYAEYAGLLRSAFEHTDEKTVLIESSKGIYYPSDQKSFRKNIGVAAFKKSRFGLYLDRIHTKHDTVMDEHNIEMLVDGTLRFVDSIS